MVEMQLPRATVSTGPYCLYIKLDRLELVAVTTIKVIPHGFIRLKASVIFAGFGSAVETVPNMSVSIRCS